MRRVSLRGLFSVPEFGRLFLSGSLISFFRVDLFSPTFQYKRFISLHFFLSLNKLPSHCNARMRTPPLAPPFPPSFPEIALAPVNIFLYELVKIAVKDFFYPNSVGLATFRFPRFFSMAPPPPGFIPLPPPP